MCSRILVCCLTSIFDLSNVIMKLQLAKTCLKFPNYDTTSAFFFMRLIQTYGLVVKAI